MSEGGSLVDMCLDILQGTAAVDLDQQMTASTPAVDGPREAALFAASVSTSALRSLVVQEFKEKALPWLRSSAARCLLALYANTNDCVTNKEAPSHLRHLLDRMSGPRIGALLLSIDSKEV